MASTSHKSRQKSKQPVKNRLFGVEKTQTSQQSANPQSYWQFIKSSSVDELRQKMAAPFMLMVIGLTASIYLSFNLNKPVALEAPVAGNVVPTQTITQQPVNYAVTLARSEPVRVRIAKVGIDAPTMPVGKKADGTMQVPGKADITGWYTLAPTPGELGPAIIVGHVDQPGGPAVFWRLRELIPGDVVEVVRADGKTIKFNVDRVEQFEQRNFPTQAVYGNIDHAGIRLITCGGVFDREIRQYSHNTVVFGSLITE